MGIEAGSIEAELLLDIADFIKETKRAQTATKKIEDAAKKQAREVAAAAKLQQREATAAARKQEKTVKEAARKQAKEAAAIARKQQKEVTAAAKKQASEVEKAAKKQADSAITLGKVMKGVFAGIILKQIFNVANEMVNLSSDAQESLNLMNVTFADQVGVVNDWAENMAAGTGRSQQSLKDMAGTLGALIVPMVGNREEAAKFSTQLSQLAVDMASFFNAADVDVLTALRSGLVGETEPLKKFGVDLREVKLESLAMSQGIKGNISDLSDLEKVQLRVDSIFQQTVLSQGDAIRTAGGYENVVKSSGAALQDFKRTLGAIFLPAFREVIVATREGILFWDKLIKRWTAAKNLSPELAGATEDQKKELEALNTTIAVGAKNVGKWTEELIRVNKAIEDGTLVGNAATSSLGETNRMLEFQQKRLTDSIRKQEELIGVIKNRSKAEDELRAATDAARKAEEERLRIQKEFKKALDSLKKSAAEARSEITEFLNPMETLGLTTIEAEARLASISDELAIFQDVAIKSTDMSEAFTMRLNDLTAEQAALFKNIQANNTEMDKQQKQLDRIGRAAVSSAGDLQMFLSPIEALDVTAEEARARLRDVSNEMFALSDAAAAPGANVDMLKAQIQRLREEAGLLKTAINEDEAALRSLNATAVDVGEGVGEALGVALASATRGGQEAADAWSKAWKSIVGTVLDSTEKIVLANAVNASSGAAAAVAAIPVIGPLLVAGAIATTFAAVKALLSQIPGFADGGIVGGRGGKDNNLAFVSKGEGILDPSLTAMLRSALSVPTPVSGGGATPALAPIIISNESPGNQAQISSQTVIQTWGLPDRATAERWDRDVVQNINRRRNARRFDG